MLQQQHRFEWFDLDTFDRYCKPFLTPKDRLIAENYGKPLAQMSSALGRRLSILDVGTGEGSLIRKIADTHPTLALAITCVEPEKAARPMLESLQAEHFRDGRSMRIETMPISGFLEKVSETYDVIFCNHCLYHINKQQWENLILSLRARLSESGRLFVELVSQESDIYRIYSCLESQPGFSSATFRTFDIHGYLYFAEDLASLRSAVDAMSTRRLESYIQILPDALREIADQFSGRRGEARFIQFLAFMFRMRPQDLAVLGRPCLHWLIAPSNLQSGLSLKTIDTVFEFGRPP